MPEIRKRLWNVKVTVIPIVGGVLGRVSKNLQKHAKLEIRGIIETI